MAVRLPGKDELAAIARGYGGKRFDDATCLRVAHAFERLTGGFPAPPAAA